MDFERGRSPLDAMEIGWRTKAKEWLDENDISNEGIITENPGTEEFAVVVIIDWHVLNLPFDNNGEIRIPEKVVFRAVQENP